MPTNAQIEQHWIAEKLDEHGEYLTDLFIEAIQQKDIINSGELLDYFDSGSKWKVANIAGTGMLSFPFFNYGRFVEIQSIKRRKIKTETPDTNAAIWGIKTKKKKSRTKNAQWYTKNVYGAQNRLIGRIMYGLSDIERNRIIETLKQAQ